MDGAENIFSTSPQHVLDHSGYTHTALTPLPLKAKLSIPPIQSSAISRPHLVKLLDVGMQHKLTLISASAGFGKTTLLSEWASRTSCPIAWVSLDKSDNDPIHFWHYVIAALETLYPGIGKGALELLRLPQGPPIESMLAILMNAIEIIQQDFALVLDNYHVIDTCSIQQSVTFLLDYLPPHMHLVVTSRVDPPLPLACLRVKGQLTELGSTDLLFTYPEMDAFLTRILKLELPADIGNFLKARTEGWIAGLQLVVHALQRCTNVSHFIAEYNGSHRYIQDYLIHEVLQKLPENVKSFLLQTSILDRLNSSLCDTLTGQNDSQAILELLEQMNLFLIPLDNHRHWYRYHQLFADFLYTRLQRLQREQIPMLHHRAYEWYEHNGFKAAAVRHALAAAQTEQAARLIMMIGEEMVRRNEIATVQRWLEALPSQVVRSHPRLCLLQARMLITSDQFDEVETWLQEARNELDKGAKKLSTVSPEAPSQAEDAERQAMLDEILALQAHVAALKACTGDTTKPGRDCCVQATSPLPGQLSEREFEVMQFLIVGKSVGEIAEQMIIAESTVKWYIKSIYSKLNVHSRMQLIVYVRNLGIDTCEEERAF